MAQIDWISDHVNELVILRSFALEDGLQSIESFNGRLRDECLNTELFWDMRDAQEKLEKWRIDYNTLRPHSALDDQTPETYTQLFNQKENENLVFSKDLV